MNNSNFNIESISKGCLRKERVSQLKLYQNYFSFCYNICLRYAKDKSEADLILNDAWVSVFQKIKKFKTKNEFETWLKKEFLNEVIKFHVNNFNWKNYSSTSPFQTTFNEEVDFKNLNYFTILNAIQSLPLECRMVFCLATIENYSFSEIAKSLDLDIQTIKNCLNKAKLQLIKMLHSMH